MKKVLLTVSGTIPADLEAQIARGERPLTDYVAMARGFDADLLDFGRAFAMTGRFGRLLARLGGPNLVLAWACFLLRREYEVMFTDGEQVGLPLALFFKFLSLSRRRPRHLMIVHILSVGKKMWLLDALRLHTHIDQFFCYATWQKQFIEVRWQLPPQRVVFTPFMVDHHFFSPDQATAAPAIPERAGASRPLICSVGLEFRDYPTLMDAVAGLDVDVIVAAGSPWSKREDTTQQAVIPDNVIVRRFSQFALRDVYAQSALLVMPLFNVNFQAGVTALLEAMAMEKAVVCSLTPGQTDVVVDGVTGRYVPPGDAAALRHAITRLLADPQQRAAMGAAGRRRIVEEMSLEQYVLRLQRYVQAALSSRRRQSGHVRQRDARAVPVRNSIHETSSCYRWRRLHRQSPGRPPGGRRLGADHRFR